MAAFPSPVKGLIAASLLLLFGFTCTAAVAEPSELLGDKDLVLLRSIEHDELREAVLEDLLQQAAMEADATNLDRLPKAIEPPAGEITVFADFDDAADTDSGQHVPIYVINRTAEPLTFSLQDSHSYFQLEVEIDGQWRRATPFSFSWCGNSYRDLVIEPEHFDKVNGFLADGGDIEAPTRFRRLYALPNELDELASNTGTARYSIAGVDAARFDPLSISTTVSKQELIDLVEGRLRGDDTYPTTISAAARKLANDFPNDAADMVRSWDVEQLSAMNASDGLAMLPLFELEQLSDDDVLKLVEASRGNFEIRRAALWTLGERLPDRALDLLSTIDANPADDEQELAFRLILGMLSSDQLTAEQLLQTVRHDRRLGIDSIQTWELAHYQPVQALAIREALRQELGESFERKLDYFEKYVIGRSPESQLVAVIRGEIQMKALSQQEAEDLAIDNLVRAHRDRAERLLSELQSTDVAKRLEERLRS